MWCRIGDECLGMMGGKTFMYSESAILDDADKALVGSVSGKDMNPIDDYAYYFNVPSFC